MGGLKGAGEPARLGVPDEVQLSVGVLPRTGKGRNAVGPSDVGLAFIVLESDGLSAYSDSLAYGSVSDLSYTVCVRAARSSIQFEKRAGGGADFRLRRRQIKSTRAARRAMAPPTEAAMTVVVGGDEVDESGTPEAAAKAPDWVSRGA
jgi:hypothetical protein